MRILITVTMAALLAACQTTQRAPNAVGMDVLSNYHVAEINVEVPSTARIVWGEAEAEYAATQNCYPPVAQTSRDEGNTTTQPESDCDFDAVTGSAEAKEFVRERVQSTMASAAQAEYGDALDGSTPAVLNVRVTNVVVVSGGQAVMVGGAHNMAASFGLSDQETGAPIVPPMSFQEDGGYAPGGLLAVIVEASSDPAPVRLSNALAQNSRAWMLNEPAQ